MREGHTYIAAARARAMFARGTGILVRLAYVLILSSRGCLGWTYANVVRIL